MKKDNFTLQLLLVVMTLLVATWIGSFSAEILSLLWIKIISGLLIIIIGAILIQGIFTVKNDPPHFAMITKWGVRDWKEKGKIVFVEEGLQWVFLKDIVFKPEMVEITQKQKLFDPQGVLTPDNVDEKVPISIGYSPDPYDYITFINLGKHDGVLVSIREKLESELRRWSRHRTEGPQSWEELVESSLKLINFLVKHIGEYLPEDESDKIKGYDYLENIDSTIPTPILIDWYEGKSPPNSLIREEFGDGKKEGDYIPGELWKKLEEKLDESMLNNCNRSELRNQIKKRINLLAKLSDGKAKIPTKSLGIILQRISITEIKPFGSVYEAAIVLQKEKKERISEIFEVETDMDKAGKLQERLSAQGSTVSLEECLALIMKWKMIREGKGFVYDGPFGSIAGIGDMISSIMKGGKK